MNNTIIAQGLAFEPFIPTDEIAARVDALGHQISEDYKGKCPLFLCILNGSFIFAADLVRACEMECELGFVRLSSYDGVQSSGVITTVLGLEENIKGRHIVIVEDIVDSGRTLHHFLQELNTLEPASVALAVLLVKPEALHFPIRVDYLGFEISDKFVVGYGLDYNGLCRNLKGIYQLKV